MRHSARPLKIAAALEPASLAILLLNLAFGNAPSIAAAVGPIHGCLYLFVIIATARDPRTTPRITALSIVPGVGGLLALGRLSVRANPRDETPPRHERAADARCGSPRAAAASRSTAPAPTAPDSSAAAGSRR
jgi:hypothetical protein